MKALITAAGMGTRLGKLTEDNNKGLIKIGKKSLLSISLYNLYRNNVRDVAVVTGHAFKKVEKELSGKARFVFNPFYSISGILPSIWLARDFIVDDDFVFLTTDSIYDPSILSDCLSAKGDIVICVQKKKCDAEDSKVVIKNNRIMSMGKDIKRDIATGEFMGMMKVNKKSAAKFFNGVDSVLKQGRLNGYVTDVLTMLSKKGLRLSMVYTGSRPYIEIDTPEDLMKAKKQFSKIYR